MYGTAKAWRGYVFQLSVSVDYFAIKLACLTYSTKESYISFHSGPIITHVDQLVIEVELP